ncbi:hypothetical protein FUAX_19240 [Fulvitalea axinellae]|uniref:Leucine-rich repeat domain-containing protein n=1 Tax=Fulvitalea axinellae TaxID=1182444 RepID=A0AAU9CNG3_9BACT|nr:hypothetical protein FUAX_19240 [Fulvitalea axinellae]
MRYFQLIFFVFCLSTILLSCAKNDDEESANLFIEIPDSRFEELLIESGIDSDKVVNKKILRSDAEKITHLELNSTQGNSIKDLAGIEGFVNLDTLSVTGNFIDEIDFSHNKKLIKLNLDGNNLLSVKGLGELKSLRWLNVSYNDLTELKIDNPELEEIYVRDNQLEELDVSGSQKLKAIYAVSNKISALDLSANTQLETIILSDNKLESVSLEKNIGVKTLYISSNSLKVLDVSFLVSLDFLRVDRNPDLTCVKIRDNQNIPTVEKSSYQVLAPSCQ